MKNQKITALALFLKKAASLKIHLRRTRVEKTDHRFTHMMSNINTNG